MKFIKIALFVLLAFFAVDSAKINAVDIVNDVTVVVSPYDLTASAPSPSTAVMNSPQVFNFNIINNGDTDLTTDFSYFFQVGDASGNNLVDKASTLETQTIGANGGSVTASFTHTFTSGGAYTVRVCVDKTSSAGGGVVDETDEENNCSALTAVGVAALHSITFNGNGNTGGSMSPQVMAEWTSGSLSDNAFTKTGYYFSGWATTSSNQTLAYSNKATYYMGNSDVTLYAMWTLTPLPELMASMLTPNSAKINTTQTYSATVTNTGTASTGQGFDYFFQTTYYPDDDDYENSPDIDIVTGSMGTLALGESGTASVSYTYTQGAGAYYARFCVDKIDQNDSGIITESNENNNCGAWEGVVVGGPNLTASAVTPNVVTINTSTTFTSSIQNIGAYSTLVGFPYFFQVCYRASDPNCLNPEDKPSTTTSLLTAGASRSVTKDLTFSTVGSYSIRACVDKTSKAGGGVIEETSEDDNCSPTWTNLNILSPNLTITDSIIPTTAVAGIPTTFSTTVKNAGTTSTVNSFSNLFEVKDSGGNIIDTKTSPNTYAIGPGNTDKASISYTFSSSGTYSVYFCADSNTSFVGGITESNEGDNCNASWTDVTVRLPSITVSPYPLSYDVERGSNHPFSYTVTTETGNGAECRLLDNNITPFGTTYSSSSPIYHVVPSVVGDFGYYVQCHDKVITQAEGIGPTYPDQSIHIKVKTRITFDSNGGTPSTPTVSNVNYGDSIGAFPVTPTRTGYTFNGWNTASNGTGSDFLTTTTVISDTTVYAKWTQSVYTISGVIISGTTVSPDGGTISPSLPKTVSYGGTASFTITPTVNTSVIPNIVYSISSVTGCGGSLTGSTYTTGTITSNCTITATFKQTTGTLSSRDTFCTIGVESSTCGIDFDWSITNPIGVPTAITSSNSESSDFDTYTDVMTSPSGSKSGIKTINVPYGTNVFYLYNNAKELAQTEEVTVTCNEADGYYWDIDANSCLLGKVPVYTEKRVMINGVTSVSDLGGNISPASADVPYGSSIPFTVTSNVGYSISSVTGCGGSLTGSTYNTGIITSGCTVIATFKKMTGDLTANIPSCLIQIGSNTCYPTLGWSISYPIGETTAITSPGMTDINVKSNTLAPYSGTAVMTMPIEYNNSKIFFLYNNSIKLDEIVPTATCNPVNAVWSPAQNKCISNMTGTISAASCKIGVGNSGCGIKLTWNTVNPVSTSAVTTEPFYTVATGNSNTSIVSGSDTYTVNCSGFSSIDSCAKNFYLYNNSSLLATDTTGVSCDYGSDWVYEGGVGKCVAGEASGELISNGCYVQEGQGSCNTAKVEWIVRNPTGNTIIDASYGGAPIVQSPLRTGESTYSLVLEDPTTLTLYTAGTSNPLSTLLVTATCALGTHRDGDICVRNPLTDSDIRFWAEPSVIFKDKSSTLVWETNNTTSCSIKDTTGGGSVPVDIGTGDTTNGRKVINNITVNRTYVITCENSVGPSSKGILVKVVTIKVQEN